MRTFCSCVKGVALLHSESFSE